MAEPPGRDPFDDFVTRLDQALSATRDAIEYFRRAGVSYRRHGLDWTLEEEGAGHATEARRAIQEAERRLPWIKIRFRNRGAADGAAAVHDLGAALGRLSEYIEQGYFEQPSEGEVWGPNEAEDWSFEGLETATAFLDRARNHQREFLEKVGA